MNAPKHNVFETAKERHAKLFEKAVRKGKADSAMIPLCKWLNAQKDYFTTSSCSGRIALMDLNQDEKKKENALFATWHRTAKWNEFNKALHAHAGKNTWFKQEPLVLVLGTNSPENAQKIMRIVRSTGIKRVGIMTFQEGKWLVELFGSQGMSFMAKENEKLLAPPAFLKTQLRTANRKMKRNAQQLHALENALKESLR